MGLRVDDALVEDDVDLVLVPLDIGVDGVTPFFLDGEARRGAEEEARGFLPGGGGVSRLMILSSPVVFLPAGFDPLLAPEEDAFLAVLGGMMTSLLSSSLA